ncbi:MAG TPA: Ig-like domain-containing protein [Thermoanaerobaculia bacterium]|nr:Ig-like domain-containing protein [Thermoanaerobaculia bacterium]
MLGNAVLQSADPIRTPTIELTGPTGTGGYTAIPGPVVAETVVVSGNVQTRGIAATTLTVKAGAKLTSLASTATEVETLDLNVTGVLTIEAGGSIEVSGRGYLAKASYPGTTASSNSGGSHVGVGGIPAGGTAALTYGSVTRPQEAGGGGWYSNGSAGGGVVRIDTARLVLGGPTASILANGVRNSYDAGGAGGSIWITAESIEGSGRIEAAGVDGYWAYWSGGGGAMAIEYGSIAEGVRAGVSAKGGAGTGIGESGGAGTVVLKGPGQSYGTLRVDNKGTSGQATVLPSFGSGTAQEGTGGATLVTGRSGAIPAYFEGHWVEVRRAGTLLGTWRIGGITGGTVTLAPNESEAIELQAGDAWQGVYRFDRVDVLGNAVLQSADTVYDGLPSITVTSPGPDTVFASGASVPVTFQTADDRGVTSVELSLGGPAVQIPGATQTSGVVKAPWVGTNTSVPLEATVVDTVGQRTVKTVPLTILAAPSLTASISHPWDGAKLWAGTSQEVRVELPDARPIRRVTIGLGTFSMDFEDLVGPSLDLSIPIPPVTVDEDRLLTATVEDGLGALVTSPAVPVTLLVDNGPRVTAWTEAVSPVNAGSRVQVDFSAYFRGWEGSQLRLQVTGSMSYLETYNAGEFGSGGAGGVAALDVADSVSWSFPSFQIPADARGPMKIVVTAIDGAGREASADPIELEVTSPFSIAVVGSGTVPPGGTLELALSATGWSLPDSVDLAIGGAFEWARPVSLGERYGESDTVSRTIRIPVPRNALGEGSAAFEAYMGGGEYSRGALAAKLEEGTASSNTVTFSVVDETDPVIARIRSSRWGLVSGDEVTFRADVSDNGTVQAVRFLVDGALIATVNEPTEMSTYESGPHVLPTGAEERNVVVRVEATDLAGRTSSAERTFVVAPAGTPLVRFRAPTSGAMAIAGLTLPLMAELRHPRPITQLAFYRDDEATPFATGSGEDLTAEFLVPPGATPGSEITLWVEATDDLGAIGEASTVGRIVGGTLLTDGTVLDSDDMSNEDQAIVVQGRVEVGGGHRFARLVVLPGSVLTHAATTSETIGRLDLEVTGDVYVSPSATIDAIGLGFEGGLQGSNSSPEGRTLPGLQGAPAGFGGSHAGEGEFAGEGWAAATFGSSRSPDLPGGGGGAAPNGDPGGPGGGVIRLRVGGRLIVDGAIDASGASGEGGAAGAGASTWKRSRSAAPGGSTRREAIPARSSDGEEAQEEAESPYSARSRTRPRS